MIRKATVEGAGGVRLAVLSAGAPGRTPVVFVHGLTQSSIAFTRQLRSGLAVDHHLVAFDLRGHGESGKPESGYGDSRVWADDIQAVIDQFELDRPILVGWSYGGILVCDYLRHYGDERIAGINFVGAANRVGTPAANADLGADAVPPGFVSSDAEESVAALSGFVSACTFTALPVDEHAAFLGFNVLTPPRVRLAMLGRVAENDDVLSSLSVPVLVTQGEHDIVVHPESARRLAGLIPGAELSLFRRSGHCPFWEEAERFNDQLLAFAARSVRGARV